MRGTLFLLLALVGLCCCVSCALLGLGTHFQKKLPRDWPIQRLAFTGDVSLIRAVSRGRRMPGRKSKVWTAYVHCDGGIEKVAANVEASLAPLAYQHLVLRAGGEGNLADIMRLYYSVDGRIEVTIVGVPHEAAASEDDVMNERESLKAGPVPDSTSIADFMVMVAVNDEPSREYTEAARRGFNSAIRLEPLSQQ